MKLGSEVLDFLAVEMLAMAEEWADMLLEHTATFGQSHCAMMMITMIRMIMMIMITMMAISAGPRRYTNHSWMVAHVDCLNGCAIGAIVNVGQKVEKDWPFFIKDNLGADHKVTQTCPGKRLQRNSRLTKS